jgi:hypothetical protein
VSTAVGGIRLCSNPRCGQTGLTSEMCPVCGAPTYSQTAARSRSVSLAEVVAAAGAVGALGSLWLTWYTISLGPEVRSALDQVARQLGAFSGAAQSVVSQLPLNLDIDAWQAFSTTDVVVAVCAGLGLAVLVLATGVAAPAITVGRAMAGRACALLGAGAAVPVFVRAIHPPHAPFLDTRYGAWLGLLALLAMAAGGAATAGARR